MNRSDADPNAAARGAVAVIPAAGAGVRMGADRPKQFLTIDGRPLLALTLEAFEQCEAVESVVLVVPEDSVEDCEREMVRGLGLSKVRQVIPGGERRQDSVRRGVEACPDGCDIVVVHDGVRPLVRPELIERAVSGAREHGAVVAALPAKETVKEVEGDGRVRRTLDRGSLWLVQTPQAFRRIDLLEAHRKAVRQGWGEMSDDALLLETAGLPVRVIPGAEDNIKVTTPHDLVMARCLLALRFGGDSGT